MSDTAPAPPLSTVPAGDPEVRHPEEWDFPVRGMTCAACVRHVERALGKVPGVESASVNLITQRATVRFDPARADRALLVRAVEGAGYEVPRPRTLEAVEGQDAPVASRIQARLGADLDARSRALREAEEQEEGELRRDFRVAAPLTVLLLVLAMSHGAIPGSEGPVGRALQFALATPIVFGPGRRFLRLGLAALRRRSADMYTLVGMGVIAAWGYSAVAVLVPSLFPHAEHGVLPHLYFEASAAIITFVLLGKRLESRARKRLSDAVRGLISLVPESATRVSEREDDELVPVGVLNVGDVVLVHPGERIPTDGEVLLGASAVDESLLTGESLPVDKHPGSLVFGGTLNQGGALRVRVTRTGSDTALGRVVEAVEQAQGSRAPIARLADVVSSYFVPLVLVIATGTLVAWLALDPSSTGLATAIERFVAVLVIACPCALGLATPAAVAAGTARGAELGVLIKGGEPLEAASRVDTVLLDKTGTLTTGKPELTDIVDITGQGETALLELVASVERESEHPVARSIVEGAAARGVELRSTTHFRSQPGHGVEARVDANLVRIGTSAWLEKAGIDSSPLEAKASELARAGRTPSFVAVDGALAGLIAVADRPTEAARSAILALKQSGIDVAMISGDRELAARAVACELGIERVYAEVKPEEKARIVETERARGRIVAMVGDGINDAPALAAAHVGVALGTGADIAVAAADIALLRGGLQGLPTALRLARRTLGTIRQNLFWAFVYNLIGIPVAAGALYPFTGWQLSPVLASAAMSLSSVSVLLNSLRLKRLARADL
jgi:Cu+-exporting ATPase